MTRRERIDQLLGEERLPGAMESTWEYHGVRYVAAMTLALLEIADSLTDIATQLSSADERGAYDPAGRAVQLGALATEERK